MDETTPQFLREMPPAAWVGILVIAVGVLIFVIAAANRRGRAAFELGETAAGARPAYVPPPEPQKIATLVERDEPSGWGVFWCVMMAINCLLSLFGSLAANTVFQQIQVGVAFIGCVLLFGLGIATNRKRTYIVYRTPERE